MAAVSQDRLNINSRQILRRSLRDLPSFLVFFSLCGGLLDNLPLCGFLQAPAQVMCDTIFPSRGSGWALLAYTTNGGTE